MIVIPILIINLIIITYPDKISHFLNYLKRFNSFFSLQSNAEEIAPDLLIFQVVIATKIMSVNMSKGGDSL